MRRLVLPLLLAFLWLGCDSASPAEDRIVSGVDLDILFASPSDTELTTISNEWDERDTSVHDETVVMEQSLTLPGDVSARVRVYSHTVEGVLHYGGVIVPDGAELGTLPALVYLHGGDAGVSIDGEVLFILGFFAPVASQFAIVIPSFRDEPLRLGSQTFQSAGPPSPWNYDVDDAMALLGLAITDNPEIDRERIGVLGLSRGGGVGMLMGIRDPRVSQVVAFFGPTDFFGTFVQDVTEEALLGMPRNLPGLDYLNATFIAPLGAGQIAIDTARIELVRRSPVLFADRLPDLQIHHGTADTTVPVSQAESMISTMAALGRTAPEFDAYLYDGGTHNPLTMDPSLSRTGVYLERLLAQ